jgi:hypothetical protein
LCGASILLALPFVEHAIDVVDHRSSSYLSSPQRRTAGLEFDNGCFDRCKNFVTLICSLMSAPRPLWPGCHSQVLLGVEGCGGTLAAPCIGSEFAGRKHLCLNTRRVGTYSAHMPTPDRRGGRSNIWCPKCQMLGTTRRSRTRWWEQPLRLVSPRKPYRCRQCRVRFWLGPWRERRTARHVGWS